MTENNSEVTDGADSVQSEKTYGQEVPKTIIQEVERFLASGEKPGADGTVVKAFNGGEGASKGIGDRGGLCGYAAKYTSEIVDKMTKTGEYRLAGCVIQAKLLGKILPDNLFHNFRQHGFSIVVDRNSEKWWMIGTTLSQFVEKTESGGLQMRGSRFDVSENNESLTSKAAQLLLKDGYIEMTRDNLAAYITLMVQYDGVNSEYTDEVSKSLKERTDFKIDDLTNKCLEKREWKVGDWSGALATNCPILTQFQS